MSDLQLLFVVLALLYVWECACWLPRPSLGFFTWVGRHWRNVQPSLVVGNQQGGFILAPPLPPLGWLLVANPSPLSVSCNGFLNYVPFSASGGPLPPQFPRWLPFREVVSLEASGRKVIVNGRVLLRAPSGVTAGRIARTLVSLWKQTADERSKTLETMACAAFDTSELQARWALFRQAGVNLRWFANALVAYVFAACPVLIWQFGFSRAWPFLLGGLLMLTSLTSWTFHRAHRRLFPEAEEDRFTHSLTILLAPATAMRAHDILSRPLLSGFHPVAVAKSFCSDLEWRRIAARAFREIRYPMMPNCPLEEPEAVKAELESRGRHLKALELFLKRQGVDPEKLLSPPSPTEATNRSHCPRCLAQFTTSSGHCADCGGIPLEPLPATTPVDPN
jgi:hypothetical protein